MDAMRLAKAYAEAAFRPRPRDPPVTTTTLPLREKRDGKSWSAVSSAIFAVYSTVVILVPGETNCSCRG